MDLTETKAVSIGMASGCIYRLNLTPSPGYNLKCKGRKLRQLGHDIQRRPLLYRSLMMRTPSNLS